MNERYIIFECLLDLAKNILATAVVSSIKKAYPDHKIIVVTSTPEVWLHNPDIFRFYAAGKLSYFYDEYVKDKETIVMRHNPLNTDDFLHKRKHLIEIWCDLCGVPYDGSMPHLHFTWREKEAVTKLTASEKPLFFIQTHANLWPTDLPLPIAEKVVNMMNEKGYACIHIRTEQQPALANTLSVRLDTRLLLYAISRGDKLLLIDSYALQAATAFNKSAVVVWIAHNPVISSYPIHKNIHANATGPFKDFIESYDESSLIHGAQLECPYDLRDIFDAEKLVAELLPKDTTI